MKKIIVTIVFLALTAALSLSHSTLLNGMTTIEIAHKLPILLMPADITFIIRPIIFLCLAFWIYKFNSTDRLSNRRVVLFCLACFANAAWFPLWHYSYFGWGCLITLVGLLSLYTLYLTYPQKKNECGQRVPIALLFSWTLIDFVINTNYLLVLDEWNRMGLSTVLWTILNLTVLTAIALHFSYHHRDWVISSVFIWVFIGILLNIKTEELFVTMSTLFLIAILIFGFFMFAPTSVSKNRKETSI
ncbi:hypothetical protein [Sporosarcina sp. A2]|uniref:hypothetical protein n=1 Tax=Sporosarcina sp. A2 TaxID=3393449 RepID=UPI003D7BD308